MAVQQQPGSLLVAPVKGTRQWETGLLDCCSDFKTMLCAYCCLPCMLCKISTRVGEFSCVPWCVPGALITLRTRIRTLGGIDVGDFGHIFRDDAINVNRKGSMCEDCIAMSFCGICGVCQMDRELDAMGL